MTCEINKLKNLGALSENKFHSGYISPIFLKEKSNGSHRLILNLKSLNFYVHAPPFRLISIEKISKIIQRNDYLVKIDISNAYYHLPISTHHRRFLSFTLGDKIFNMNCLPFGLSSAPSIFSKLSNWTASLLREKGIRVIVYLDDFLLMNQNSSLLSKQVQETVKLLEHLGWHINLKKSDLAPKTSIQYLGLIWDTKANLKRLPNSKIANFSRTILHTLRQNHWCWLTAKRLLGKLTFASNVVPLGLLHCRLIQIAANTLPDKRRHETYQLLKEVKEELNWWLINLTEASTIQPEPVSSFITTDASDIGWGAIVDGKKLKGQWSNSQKLWHSNRKELWTLFLVLNKERKHLGGKSIIIQTDNRSTAAYIRQQGGTKSKTLLNISAKILNFAQTHKMTLTMKYLPGRYNGLADHLSRGKTLEEWHLDRNILNTIFQKMGKPIIDLFATAESAILPRYVSEDQRDQSCEYVDAFSRPWNYKLGWIFPPPAIIPRVLQHLSSSHGHYLLVAPRWEKAFWMTEIKKMAIRPPYRIPNLRLHLKDLRTNRPPPNVQNLCLEVWKIRAGPTK